MSTITIYDFDKSASANDWRIVDDVVMGGRSNGRFSIDSDGHGIFEGKISLENNGGFSSVRYQFEKVAVTENSAVLITLKGDGKDYQFRIKDKSSTSYSYITTFKTSGEWQTIEIKLSDLYPSFRGRKLDLPNFESDFFEEIVFLIGNKREENFKLVLDKIELK
ncbi:CIA30 family protein [Flavobacterium antarcticum]|uniref:CIA30 family protein n=1 Tax=Flavobacterium antarcticum TaxID=271155 RepID=UPI00047EA16F|nr:CIA30 family protein [Flavobacterium antarcticum]